ncbi:MAG: alkene reductase [Pseudomonadota bacterium]|nr:alkene reductase [Pseudomonadota bacterium]
MAAGPDLFSPLQLGDLTLKNRMVMAPLTRNRSPGHVPGDIVRTYYTQRASAGLIITEATQVSPQGIGYVDTPGIHTEDQVRAWRTVTDSVHAAGGLIFSQLWHVGRVSHPDFHNGELPVAPSALPFPGKAHTPSGTKPMVTPRALETEETPGVVEQYRHAAAMAHRAGFDGVEIHGANGYLIDQFLRTASNHRTDAYGGSVTNRIRFALEVAEVVQSAWSRGRVGFRISPHFTSYGMGDTNPAETYTALLAGLEQIGLVYVHLIEPADTPAQARLGPMLHSVFRGRFILNGGYTQETGAQAIAGQVADAVAFGRPFLANPDLPERFSLGAPLNTPDTATFYTGGEKGYTDYPALAAA